MRFCVPIVLLLFVSPATAQHVDGRNDFRAIAPPDWTLVAPGGTDERRFVSPGKDASLSLYSTDARGDMAGHLRSWGVKPGDRVTYERQADSWAIVSGYTAEDRIFYRRTALACGGRKWHDLDFEYPAADKRKMDDFVTRASYALAAYSRVGCPN